MIEHEKLRESYRIALGSGEGEVVVKDMEQRFHIHSPTFSADPYETAFREGQRSVVLFLKNMLVDQTLINKMVEGYEDNV